MSFHGKIDPLTEADITKLTEVDDQLAKLLADYAKAQKLKVAEDNKAALGNGAGLKAEVNGIPVADVTPEVIKKNYRRDHHLTPLEVVYKAVMFEGSPFQYDLFTPGQGRILNVKELTRLFVNVSQVLDFYLLYRRVMRFAGFAGGGSSDEVADNDPFIWIARQLRERSPVRTGRWRDSHVLSANGEDIANASDVARGDVQIPIADTYVFSNPQPYSRKLEVGKTKSGRDFLASVPNHIYERVANEAASKFSDFVDVRFGFVPSDYQLAHDQRVRRFNKSGGFRSSKATSDRRAGSALELPAISLTFK